MKRTSLALPRFGNGPGLERVLALANLADLDLHVIGARSVIIVGSNGKGSVATLLAASLETHWQRVGLFTSPHMYAFNERFRINGQPIPDGDLERLEAQVKTLIERYRRDTRDEQFGEFEAWFMVAALWFAEQDCDICVFEAGIGGRLDPVRTLRAPMVVLTGVDLEHTELLGSTLTEIAFDKLEAAPDGAEIIFHHSTEHWTSALTALTEIKQFQQATAHSQVSITSETAGPGTLRYFAAFRSGDTAIFERPSGGPFFTRNLEAALAAYYTLIHKHGLEVGKARLAERLGAVSLPGRYEWFDLGPGVLIDAAHTPAALSEVANALSAEPGQGYIACFGTTDNRKTKAMTRVIAHHFDQIVVGAAHKGVPGGQLKAQLLSERPSLDVRVLTDARTALEAALALGETEGKPVAVFGGLFWAASVRDVLLNDDGAERVDFS